MPGVSEYAVPEQSSLRLHLIEVCIPLTRDYGCDLDRLPEDKVRYNIATKQVERALTIVGNLMIISSADSRPNAVLK